MIFLAGVYPKQKKIDYKYGVAVCYICGKYGRYDVYVEYNTFSLFFIPIVKWKKRYFVVTTCCQERLELDSLIGARLEKGEEIQIKEEDLTRQESFGGVKYCKNCGQPLDRSFTYCPNCGEKQS